MLSCADRGWKLVSVNPVAGCNMADSGQQNNRVAVVIPAYNASATISRVCAGIPSGAADEIIVVDDCSRDDTASIAEQMGATVIRHGVRGGYGAAQKTAYTAALKRGASIVVMVHGDYQYDPRLVPVASQLISLGLCDVILGNRIRTRREALSGGMPVIKYFANRSLTLIENMLAGQNLGEWHSGFRAYSRRVLETIPFDQNSDGFVCDSQVLVQCAHFGFTIGDVPMSVRYFDDSLSISYGAAAQYSLATLGVFGRWYLHRLGIVSSPLFTHRSVPSSASCSINEMWS
jgi:glycosyltransferase involved in cell wall biosynthesis